MIEVNKNSKLIYGEKVFEGEQILESVNLFSSILRIKKGDRVCIYSENRPEWIFSFFGIWGKGGIPVPVDFMSTEDELLYILKDCQPEYVICSGEKLSIVENVLKKIDKEIKILNLEQLDKELKNVNQERVNLELERDDTAVILYTSGTTGSPKGVMLSFKNLISNIESIRETNIANETDKTIAILPFHHSYPLMVSMLVPLNLGATIIFLQKLSSDEILRLLKKHKVTIIVGVPRLYNLFHRKIFEKINSSLILKGIFNVIKKINNQKLSKIVFSKVHKTFGGNIKYFVSGGAKFDEDIAKDLWALGFKIVEGYGLTETSPIISFNPPDRIKLGSVGLPIKGVKVKIVDGEIVVKGDNVMKGYYNKPDKTAEVIKDGWFYTGDLGNLDEDGYLYITGRKKDIIVLPSGKNINPEEIEQKLIKISDYIKEVAVIFKDNTLSAVIFPDFEKLKKDKVVNIEETIKWNVIEEYNLTVPDYKKIYKFTITSKELPKTRLGKIRRFLIDKFLEEEGKKVKERAYEPNFEEYLILKGYFEKIGKKEIHPDDHIELDLGLDSLEKVELQAFIERTFGIELTDEKLAELQTVSKIAEFIRDHKIKISTEEVNWKEILESEINLDLKENKFGLIFVKKLMFYVFKLYFQLEVKGVEKIPKRNFILAPNHQSFLDGFLITSSLPDDILKDTYFLAEEIYFKSKFRKVIAKNFHIVTVNINKNLKGSLQKTAFLLKNGKNVVIFPEGARTRDGKLLPFKKTFGILSKELNVPVVPLTIKGAYDSYPIGAKFPRPHKIELIFHEPIEPHGKTVDEIVEKTYLEILKGLETN